eukprot:scaffold69933_cov25-Tisochrysis_lutea.AAC.3
MGLMPNERFFPPRVSFASASPRALHSNVRERPPSTKHSKACSVRHPIVGAKLTLPLKSSGSGTAICEQESTRSHHGSVTCGEDKVERLHWRQLHTSELELGCHHLGHDRKFEGVDA